MGECVCQFRHELRRSDVALRRQAVQVHVTGPFRLLCVIQDGGFHGCVWVSAIGGCCDCACCDDIRTIVHDFCWQFLQQMEVFLSIVGCGAGGRELRLRRLKPLAWVLGKKCWHDAYGYMCFGDGGVGRRHGGGRGGGCEKGMCVCAKFAMLRWLITQSGLLGGH